VLLVPRGARLRGPVLALAGLGEEVLAAGRWLAEATRSDLAVLAPGSGAPSRLRAELRRQPKGVLVVSGSSPLAHGTELQCLLQDAAAPVLVVRGRSA
jgi:hypothetical protein